MPGGPRCGPRRRRPITRDVALHSQAAGVDGLTPPTQRGFSSRFIGDVVVDLGFAPREVVDLAVQRARATSLTTGQQLLDDGTLTPDDLARVVAERFGLDHVDLSAYRIDDDIARLISPVLARRYGAVPIGTTSDNSVLVALSEPSNVIGLDDIAAITGRRVRPAIAAPEDIEQLIGRIAGEAVQLAVEHDPEPEAAATYSMDLAAASDEDGPVVRLVHAIIQQAVERGASDIHFSPLNGDMRASLRIDGVLVQTTTVQRRMVPAVISRIKVMSDLDISERRQPQDGRMTVMVSERPIDLRVVTLPLVGGETVVLRVLDRASGVRPLPELGMGHDVYERFGRTIRKTYGAILVTGPTGSGKTSSLYAALAEVDRGARSVMTIEDPVEIPLDGVKQMQVNAKAGVTFASGLRAILRADPDVVLVGEIRDRETARTAIEAALTGHLLLSTMHTNDAPTAVARLLEMGIEPFLVASALEGVVAQRLVRRLCADCKVPTTHHADDLIAAGFQVAGDVQAFTAQGCKRCGNSGHKGRLGLFEILVLDDDVRGLILRQAPAHELRAQAAKAGMASMRQDGLLKVLAGEVALTEVVRVLG